MNLTDSPLTASKPQRPPVVPVTLEPDSTPHGHGAHARSQPATGQTPQDTIPAWGAAITPPARPAATGNGSSNGNGNSVTSSAATTRPDTMTVALERPAAATTTPAATQTGTAPAGSTASASAHATANQAAAAPVADPRIKQKGEAKTARIPIKIIPIKDMLRKPEWIRKQAPKLGSRYYEMKEILRDHKLHTVCEEASCPNIGECFGKGTASFMIMGDKCTRRCPFCDVGHGRPDPLDQEEPHNLAQSVKALRLKYVVITSVDRDDLRDGGAGHYANCIREIRRQSPLTQIEILVPDFRGRLDKALDILDAMPPDVMNHNLETVPRLYKQARPGASYEHSLKLLKDFKIRRPGVPSKSGLMVGLGETDEEILQVMRDMREHDIDRLTIGQYLAPTRHHLPVERYVTPETFRMFEEKAYEMGFQHAAVGAMVRSSYHADMQAEEAVRNSEQKTA
jgi:hypothetical protein